MSTMPDPSCTCGHPRSEHAYVVVDGPCGARSDGCRGFVRAVAECACAPQNVPWMTNHVTYCPFYPWTEEARRLAFQRHYRDLKLAEVSGSTDEATQVVGNE